MNAVFDLKRWLLFTGKHWNENKKKYLLGLAAIAALMVIWFFIVFLMEPRPRPFPAPMQSTTYFVGLFVVGLLFSSLMFAELAEGSKGIYFLMVPASHFEKLLTAFLFSTILFFVGYTLIFYGVDFVMVRFANSLAYRYGEQGEVQALVNMFGAHETDHEPKVFYLFFMLYAALQPAFLLGSVYFARYSFIKTAICLLLVFLFFLFLVAQVLDEMMPAGSYPQSLVRYNINTPNGARLVALPDWIGDTLVFVFKYALAPLFLVVTYFRLKEKEV